MDERCIKAGTSVGDDRSGGLNGGVVVVYLACAVGERTLEVVESKLDGAVLGAIRRSAEAAMTGRKDGATQLGSAMRSEIVVK